MKRWTAAVAVFAGSLLAACQSGGPDLKQQNEALEKRVAELEQKLQPSPAQVVPTPYTEPTTLAPAPADPAPIFPAPKPVTRTRSTRSTRSTTPRATAPAPAPVPVRTADRVETVDRPAAGDPGPSHEAEDLEKFAPRVVPEGTSLELVLETALASDTSRDGQRVVARVSRALGSDGRVVLPGGSILNGHVVEADSAGRVKGRSSLTVAFDELVVRGKRYKVDTTDIRVEGPESHKHDAAVVAGSTIGGAVIGGILGGGKGAKKGAIIGAGAGTGAVLITKGKEITIPSGTRWTVKLKDGVRLD